VELVIRLPGHRLLGKVFALYALHADSSHFCSVVCTWPHVTIILKFSCRDGDQNRILTAVLDLSVMQQQLVVLYTRVFPTKGFITLMLGRISFKVQIIIFLHYALRIILECYTVRNITNALTIGTLQKEKHTFTFLLFNHFHAATFIKKSLLVYFSSYTK
jgi:hypothetical protein